MAKSDFPCPSPPVGQGGNYSVVMDDDDDDDEMPVSLDQAMDDMVDEGTTRWHYVHDEDDEPLSRFPLDGDLGRPLLFSQTEPTRLNYLNYLNLISYLCNLFVSWGIGVWGLDGLLPTRVQVFKDVETLVTPAKWAYYLWAPILVFEAIFAIAQLVPHYRARPIIQDGTSFFFFYTCVIQTAWTLFFAFRLFILSFVAILAALFSLASLLASQHYSQVRSRRSLVEYWLFKFPFYLHCGWLILCSVVQFSMLFRHFTSNVGAQLMADIVALGVMLPAATFFLTGQPSGPDFVIPIVIIWSYIGIALPLHHPSPEMEEMYGHFAVVAIQDAAYFFAGTVGCMLIPRVVIWVAQDFFTINVVEVDELSSAENVITEVLRS